MRYAVHLTTAAIVVMDVEADNEHAAAAVARAQVADWTPAQIAERAHLIPELDVDAVYSSGDQVSVDPAEVRAAMPVNTPTDTTPAFMVGLGAWLTAAQSAGLDVSFSTHCWRDGPWALHGVIGVRELPGDEDKICGVVGVGQRYYVVVIDGNVVRAVLVPVVCPCAVCGLEQDLGPVDEQGECFSEDAGRCAPGMGARVCSDKCADKFYLAIKTETEDATR
jgi:hypothetical protein